MREKIKRIIIYGAIIAILGTILYAWSTTRNIQVLQEMDASSIRKIEIWSCDTPVEITEPEDIQRFVDILQSTRIHKRKSPDKAGGWISVDIYYKNGVQADMAVAIDQINFDGGEYKSIKNIYGEIDALYEEFYITPDTLEEAGVADYTR